MSPKLSKRDKYLRAKWGITEKQYGQILKAQGNRCPICLKGVQQGVSLCVDHDHVTGRIRGLLCTYCNRYLVGRHRDADKIQRVAEYLRQGTEFYAPKQPKKRRRKRK